MPDRSWVSRSVAACVEAAFAGEWGSEPNPANALVLRATDIDDEGHVVGPGAARSVASSKLRAKHLQDGDILLEGSGGGPGKPVGRVALYEAKNYRDPSICSNFFKTLRPNKSVVDQRFLWRKLAWFYKQPALLALQQQTTGIINLKFVEYLDTPLKIPAELREQRVIAEVLDTLDTTIRQTEAIIEKLKQVKQGLLHDLLTRGIDANGELRPPQSQAPHLYKDSPLGWIPKAWGSAMLDELTESDSPITYGVVKPGPEVDGGVAFVRGGDIYGGRILVDQLRTIGADVSREYRRTLLRGGELLMSLVGYPGEVAVVPSSLAGANIARQAALIRLRAPTSAVYIMHYLASPAGKRQVLASSLGSAQQVVNLSELRTVFVPLATAAEQELICEYLAAAIAGADHEVEGLGKLRQLKSGLMDDLLTGRVRVTPLLDAATHA